MKFDKELSLEHQKKFFRMFKVVNNNTIIADYKNWIYLNVLNFNEPFLKKIKHIELPIARFNIVSYLHKFDSISTITIYMGNDLMSLIKDYEYIINNFKESDKIFFDANKKFSIKDILELNKLMDLMVKDIKDSYLSSYEKYVAIYDIVKSYKTPNKSLDDDLASRNVYNILLDEYIVCVGEVNLLTELLIRVGIKSDEITCIKDSVTHSIAIVYIEDKKYGIDGFQLCDPTGDTISEDYRMNPLYENYIFLNFSFEEAEEFYDNVEILELFFERDPNKMLRYIQLEFKAIPLSMYFYYDTEEKRNKLLQYESSSDNVFRVFENLVNDILPKEKEKYTLEIAQKTIDYIQSKIYIENKENKKISYSSKMKAIYNVAKFIESTRNNSYADFLYEHFKVETVFNFDFSLLENYNWNIIKNHTEKNGIARLIAYKLYSADALFNQINLFKYQEKVYIAMRNIMEVDKILHNIGLVFDDDLFLFMNSSLEIEPTSNLNYSDNFVSNSYLLEYGISYYPELGNYGIKITEELLKMSIYQFSDYIQELKDIIRKSYYSKKNNM